MKIKKPHKNGRPHGYWNEYYSNGNLYYEGLFNNSKKYGLWIHYNYIGTLWGKEYFNYMGNCEGIGIDG